ncbi:hypothetical protein AQUCO_00200290v1 [Aquilegia coerulea]|uniref:Uncharacterized protein n=1 Tax=Aquilegia coerulea TaxID=218851 RepID=A0A2G5F2I8_AQUCA|nr:hypothetical protein AQUCO_00200290v1 [Aquilegia coerulea]
MYLFLSGFLLCFTMDLNNNNLQITSANYCILASNGVSIYMLLVIPHFPLHTFFVLFSYNCMCSVFSP